MLKSFPENYQRLARGPFGMSSLWLGKDHLIYVKGTGFLMPFLEEYKRFRFSDIQSFSVAGTSRLGKGLLFLFALLVCTTVIALILALSDSLSTGTAIWLSIFIFAALVCLALLLRHLILGPTCVCDIQTALTRERIRPLNRHHRAIEVIGRVEGLVRESQSGRDSAPESVDAKGGEIRASGTRGGESYVVSPTVIPSFSLFLVLGLVALAGLHLESLVLTGAVMLLLIAASIFLTLTLVSVIRKPTPDRIRMFLWLLLGLHFLVVGGGALYFLFAATREPAYTVGITGPLEAFTGIASSGGVWAYGLFAGLFLGFFLTGLGGLLESTKWKRQIRLAGSISRTVGGSEKGETNE